MGGRPEVRLANGRPRIPASESLSAGSRYFSEPTHRDRSAAGRASSHPGCLSTHPRSSACAVGPERVPDSATPLSPWWWNSPGDRRRRRGHGGHRRRDDRLAGGGRSAGEEAGAYHVLGIGPGRQKCHRPFVWFRLARPGDSCRLCSAPHGGPNDPRSPTDPRHGSGSFFVRSRRRGRGRPDLGRRGHRGRPGGAARRRTAWVHAPARADRCPQSPDRPAGRRAGVRVADHPERSAGGADRGEERARHPDGGLHDRPRHRHLPGVHGRRVARRDRGRVGRGAAHDVRGRVRDVSGRGRRPHGPGARRGCGGAARAALRRDDRRRSDARERPRDPPVRRRLHQGPGDGGGADLGIFEGGVGATSSPAGRFVPARGRSSTGR